MIAATKVELRALWGNNWVRLLVLAAILAPLALFALERSFEHAQYGGASGSAMEALAAYSTPVSFREATAWAQPVIAIVSVLLAAIVATSSHRHHVFQSLVVTGHPRDLLLLGRLAATWIAILVVASGCLTTAMALHLGTWEEPAPCAAGDVRCEDALVEFVGAIPAGTQAPFDAFDPTLVNGEVDSGSSLTDLPAARVVAELGSFVALCLLAGTFVVGLTTLTRSIIASGVLMVIYVVMEQVVQDAVHDSWRRSVHNLPLDHATVAMASPPNSWWSVTRAAVTMVERPYGSAWFDSVALLFVFCSAACVAGMYRISWRDA